MLESFGNGYKDLHIDINGREVLVPSEILSNINDLMNSRATNNLYLLIDRVLFISPDGSVQNKQYTEWRDVHNLDDETVINIVSSIIQSTLIHSFEIEHVVFNGEFLPVDAYGGTLVFLKDLSIGEDFYAFDQGWFGTIINHKGEKYLSKHSDPNPIEITDDMYCWI